MRAPGLGGLDGTFDYTPLSATFHPRPSSWAAAACEGADAAAAGALLAGAERVFSLLKAMFHAMFGDEQLSTLGHDRDGPRPQVQ